MIMKNFTKLFLLFLLFSEAITAYSQDHHVRIGFIGNSITIGSFLAKPEIECYPAQTRLLLQEKYGDTCIVSNYAVSGRTMLKHGDFPIWNERSFKTGLDNAPNILLICLGTNDSKPYNWDVYGKDFYADYKSMIDTFKHRNPYIKFIVCRPAPAFAVVYDIRNEVIKNGVIPIVDSIAKYAKAEVVDFYTPLVDSVSLFPDMIHPNARGAKVFAKIVFDKIVSSDIIHKVEKGHTFVTSFQSSIPTPLRRKDSTTLNWSTIDANKVYLNGKEVVNNGSIKVAPLSTTQYTLVAKGALNNDSLSLTQNVYIPILTSFLAIPSNKTPVTGNAINFKFQYSDQNGNILADTVFEPVCSVVSGYGKFINKGENIIDFVADSVGKIKLSFTIGNLVKTVSLTASIATEITNNQTDNNIIIFPNPTTDVAHFSINLSKTSIVNINIIDLNGKICLSKKQTLNTGNQTIPINISHLTNGIYNYQIEINGNIYSGKIRKE